MNFTTLSFSVFVMVSLKKIRGTQRRFPPKYIENTFWAIQGTFRCLEMDSKRRYDLNLYMFGHPRGTWVFSKLQGPQYYFPENFRGNLTYYESSNFSYFFSPLYFRIILNFRGNLTYYESSNFSYFFSPLYFWILKIKVSFLPFFGVRGAIYYVATATVIFSHV